VQSEYVTIHINALYCGNWATYYLLPDAGEWHDFDNSLSSDVKVFIDLNLTSIVTVPLRQLIVFLLALV
jgi:hypothetical protein